MCQHTIQDKYIRQKDDVLNLKRWKRMSMDRMKLKTWSSRRRKILSPPPNPAVKYVFTFSYIFSCIFKLKVWIFYRRRYPRYGNNTVWKRKSWTVKLLGRWYTWIFPSPFHKWSWNKAVIKSWIFISVLLLLHCIYQILRILISLYMTWRLKISPEF